MKDQKFNKTTKYEGQQKRVNKETNSIVRSNLFLISEASVQGLFRLAKKKQVPFSMATRYVVLMQSVFPNIRAGNIQDGYKICRTHAECFPKHSRWEQQK